MPDNKPRHLNVLETLSRILRDRDALIMPTLFASVVGSIVANFILDGREILGNQQGGFFVLSTALPVIATMLVFTVRFLSGASDRVKRLREPFDEDRVNFQKESERLRHTLESLGKDAQETLVEEIKQRLANTANDEFLTELKLSIREADHRDAITNRSASSLKRIYQEIDSLERRGTVNLSIGVVMAIVGISMLGYIVMTGSSESPQSASSLAMHFVPRFTVVIMVEFFSFFFLRLYKSSLDEIKYFQNEATNLELRFAALDTTLHFGDEALRAKVIESLLQTDRNPIMNTGMSTRELESLKQLDAKMRFTPEHLVELLRATKDTK